MSRTFPAHVITDDSALGGSVIERSLRFNNDDSAYLNRTPGSESTRRAVTLSVWLKRCNIGEQLILDAFINDSHRTRFMIDAGNRMQFFTRYSGNDHTLITNARQRDVSGWYHFVYAINTNESTASNRVKCYINGEQQTFTGSNYPDQEDLMFGAICNHTIGVGQDSGGNEYHFDGYMAEMHCIDGTQLDPTYFGYTDSQTGLWRPKKYTYGNYGTNGFYLNFKDNSSTSTLGKDTSGNGNNFTPNNFSVSSGKNGDSFIDTPTNNFPTLNSLVGGITLSDGNLTRSGGVKQCMATFELLNGKYYFEYKVEDSNGNHSIGVCQIDTDQRDRINTECAHYFANGEYKIENNGQTSGFASYTTGDIIGVAVDTTLSTPKIWFAKNNTWQGTGNPTTTGYSLTSGKKYAFSTAHGSSSGSTTGTAFFGAHQGEFNYDPPSGFKALSTKNLPPNVPSIIRTQKHFETLLYTATGNAMTVTGLEFKPDFIWQKRRDSTGGSHFHYQFDSVRGGRYILQSNTNAGDSDSGNDSNIVFKDGGFDMVASTGGQGNASGGTYAAWCWKAGGAAVTNTVGNISAQVSANDEAGFSIITYTGDGNSSGNVGTGLRSTQPLDWAIVKRRDNTSDWQLGHRASGQSSNFAYHTNLNDSSALSGSAPYHMGTQSYTNGDRLYLATGGLTSSATYVAYVWQERPGYSKFGQYTGNGSSDGVFIHLGFRARWFMWKIISGSGGWGLIDTARDTYNVSGKQLGPDDSDPEASYTVLDFTSTGIKMRNTFGDTNVSGGKFIYMAFAEQPGTTPFDTFTNAR